MIGKYINKFIKFFVLMLVIAGSFTSYVSANLLSCNQFDDTNAFEHKQTNLPKSLVKYAKKNHLEIANDRYFIDKSCVKNSERYKLICPCIDKDKNLYAILYQNPCVMKLEKPDCVDVIYLETR